MEKLGVQIDEEKSKVAGAKKDESCPSCGAKAHWDPHRNVPWCPNCGTRPFEKSPNKE